MWLLQDLADLQADFDGLKLTDACRAARTLIEAPARHSWELTGCRIASSGRGQQVAVMAQRRLEARTAAVMGHLAPAEEPDGSVRRVVGFEVGVGVHL